MKRIAVVAILVLALIVLVGCAPDANPNAGQGEDLAGFWTGLWQGATMLFTFIWSLFNDEVGIYETANNGGWYNFGYLLGALMFLGGGSGGAAKGGSRKR